MPESVYFYTDINRMLTHSKANAILCHRAAKTILKQFFFFFFFFFLF